MLDKLIGFVKKTATQPLPIAEGTYTANLYVQKLMVDDSQSVHG